MSIPRKPSRIYPGDGDPRHGTINGYQNLKCRCPDCSAAKMDYERRTGAKGHKNGNLLLVACWCEQSMVWVRDGEVRSGRTASCGRHGCEAAAA